MLASLWVAALLALPGSDSPGTTPPGASVTVETEGLVLLGPPADWGQARRFIHATLERGGRDLGYLNLQLSAAYREQEPDLEQARLNPETFRQPLPAREEELCAKIAALLKDPGPVQREAAYRKAVQEAADTFSEAFSAGKVERPENADGALSTFARATNFAPALQDLEALLGRIDAWSGPERPAVTDAQAREAGGSGLEKDLRVFDRNAVWTSLQANGCLARLEPAWKPYGQALEQLGLAAADLKREKVDASTPLRLRLLVRALLIQVAERYRSALGLDLKLWLLAAAAAPSGPEEKRVTVEWENNFDDRNRRIYNFHKYNPAIIDIAK